MNINTFLHWGFRHGAKYKITEAAVQQHHEKPKERTKEIEELNKQPKCGNMVKQ